MPQPSRAIADQKFGVCILAGGKSSRMGQEKSRLLIDGASLLTHARDSAKELGWPMRVIRRDIISSCGPLSGIYTALKSSQADAEIFLACDMPFVSACLLRRILRGLRPSDQACFATMNRLAGFPFVIRQACVESIAQAIDRGEWSLQALAKTLNARRISIPAAERGAVININTPADLTSARDLHHDR